MTADRITTMGPKTPAIGMYISVGIHKGEQVQVEPNITKFILELIFSNLIPFVMSVIV